jgi:hypothetical protein
MPDKEFVERAQGAKSELNRSASEVMSTKIAQVSPEVVPLKLLPSGRLLPFFLVPLRKLEQCLAVIALGIGRGAAIRSEMGKEFGEPGVGGRAWSFVLGLNRNRNLNPALSLLDLIFVKPVVGVSFYKPNKH